MSEGQTVIVMAGCVGFAAGVLFCLAIAWRGLAPPMSDERDYPCEEFDCVECGRHMIVFCGGLPAPLLCRACLAMPGWWRHPGVAIVIDPEGWRIIPAHEAKT